MLPTVLTASGQAKGESGQLFHLHVTAPGSNDAVIKVHDSVDASGPIKWQGDGQGRNSFPFVRGTEGLEFQTGIYVEITGTTKPTVVVIVD